MVKRFFFFTLILIFGFFPFLSQATLVVPLNIEQLIDGADRIFLGTVTSIKEESTRPFPAVVTTFQVEEVFKGKMGSTVEVRQISQPHSSDSKKRIRLFIGLPHFYPKERAIVFLSRESSLGFASPFGLEQGVFRLLSKKGKSINDIPVTNRSARTHLFRHLQKKSTKNLVSSYRLNAKTKKRPPLTVGQLRELIQTHLGTKP